MGVAGGSVGWFATARSEESGVHWQRMQGSWQVQEMVECREAVGRLGVVGRSLRGFVQRKEHAVSSISRQEEWELCGGRFCHRGRMHGNAGCPLSRTASAVSSLRLLVEVHPHSGQALVHLVGVPQLALVHLQTQAINNGICSAAHERLSAPGRPPC